ncbi:pyridoxamine 5'-phosphate oxidase family protein [Mesobacillus maritimus]|uniref:pyridoxamine 5'-phosphate oxidase family protein n=1 Tax=Mesobacillus maritimus TaxID=1643336 RepID=UPI00203B08F5|nr:pyridoxamine 5'-phosphate oxidase family protein [Mesobacillus maritimus]MCM3584531.1 pyridoxamine 5'-phosphate oxidase family protein [Mesobacillus maritimus]
MSHLQQFNNQIQTEEQLRELLGHPSELASKKVISSIDQNCMDFIELSPFIVLSTSDHLGNCDVSPRGDAPGFVKVLNEKVLLIPERPGNKRFDSLRNILGNPHIGILFFIPGLEETLRINGKANIIKDIDLLEQMQANGRTPTLAVAVEVEEAFIHCAKAFKRSKLWQADTWTSTEHLPSAARILYEHAKLPGTTAASLAERLQESYHKRLY